MPFEDTTPEEMIAVFSVNFQFPVQLTRALLPHLRRASPTPALVLNIGSQSNIGQAYAATYSATKGALHTWNRAFAAEQAVFYSKNPSAPRVDILETVVGGTYTTQLQKEEAFKPGLFLPTAEKMAKAVLARAGNGHRSVDAYFWHRVQSFVLYSLMPANTADGIVAGILGATIKPKGN